jgi:tetratricopeptide (TPR) repeat protein/peroxiredoxin
MKLLFRTLLVCIAALALGSVHAASEKRFALLIGNSSYDSAPLSNPINDVKDMGAALKSAGFEIILKENLDAEGMKSTIRDFGERMKKNKDAAGFFFFAGHGIQVNGRNFLLPVGRNYKSEQDVADYGLEINFVMHRLEEASSRISVVILDACRNNPFFNRKSRTYGSKGLAPMDAPSGTLVAFSTAPGTEASDGSGRNGLFSKHLLANIRIPGLTVEQIFKRTREGVERESGGNQSPREESSLKGDDFFVFPLDGAVLVSPAIGNAAEFAYWETIKQSNLANDFKAYLKDFPQGTFVSLAQNRIAEFSSAHEAASRTVAERATLRVGDTAPPFKINSISKQVIDNQTIAKGGMSVLFFFDTKHCKACLETLSRLRELAAQYQEKGIVVAAFGKMPSSELEKLPVQQSSNFHLISADEDVLKAFHISEMLPTVVVTTKGGALTSVIYGAGSNNDGVIFTLADSMLARGDAVAAGQLFNSLRGIQTRMTLGQIGSAYGLLKQGKRNEAALIFTAAAADTRKDMEVRGHEGLAELALANADLGKALSEADAALKIDPNRGAAHMARAKVFAAKGNSKEAERAIALAASATAVTDFSWQSAEAATARGNLLRQVSPTTALHSYQDAVAVNPFAADAMANQGAVLQAMGEPGKALEVLRQANERAPADRAVLALLRQAEQASKQKMDLERQKYIDESVKDLVARFKEQKTSPPTRPADDWTSQAMAVSVLDFQTSGEPELLGKLGMDKLLLQEFSQALLNQGVTVVDRAILDKLLAELKLGSSELADPDTQLRLGRIMAARLISTGSFTGAGQNKAVAMRIIDTETTNIAYSTTKRNIEIDPVSLAEDLAAAVVKSVREKYPLKGRIALADDDTAIVINLGKKQGAAPGQTFNVLGEGVPIELNGRVIGMREAKLGQIEITATEDLMSYAKVLEKKGPWAKNQKVILKSTSN